MAKKLGKKGLINRIEKGIKFLTEKENKTKKEIKDLEKFKVLRSMVGCMNNKLDNGNIANLLREYELLKENEYDIYNFIVNTSYNII